MTREEFEDRYGSLRDEGFTPEECGIRPRRAAAEEEADDEPTFCDACGGVVTGAGCACDQDD